MAALSVGDMKHAVVVDDDIDVFNPLDVEWAIATRVQGDRDVFIIPGARAKPLDPSLPVTPAGVVPTGAKVGIDATIPEGIPRERYERIAYAYADRARLESYRLDERAVRAGDRKPTDAEVAELAARILELIADKPFYAAQVIEAFPDSPQQAITRAFGKLHADEKLWQDPEGRMCVRGSKFAATPPGTSDVRLQRAPMIRSYNLGALYDARVGGERPALIDLLDWDNPREYTHRELDALGNAVARGLLKRGLARGDAVAILSANRAEFVISFLGIARAGLVAVPINHKFPRATLDYVLGDAGRAARDVRCATARRRPRGHRRYRFRCARRPRLRRAARPRCVRCRAARPR